MTPVIDNRIQSIRQRYGQLLAAACELVNADLCGKVVLLRVDLNVPVNKGIIADDSRLLAMLPTLSLLLGKQAKVLLASHFGRPEPKAQTQADMRNTYSLSIVTPILEALLGDQFVGLVPDCVGNPVTEALQHMNTGQVALLENVRFHLGEGNNSAQFARQLAEPVDVYVNDAFGVVHRDQASVTGITKHVTFSYPGLLVCKELETFISLIDEPKKPLVVILGGAKVADKFGIISTMVERADKLLVGGKMSFVFLKANGVALGDTEVSEPYLCPAALELQAKAAARCVSVLLPVDQVVAPRLEEGTATRVVDLDLTCCTPDMPCIEDGYHGGDIGPASIKLFAEALAGAATIFWNGPVGKLEVPEFGGGSHAIVREMAAATARGAVTVIGGGDSAGAVRACGLDESSFTHISTGGGASLELIEGKGMPGLDALLAASRATEPMEQDGCGAL